MTRFAAPPLLLAVACLIAAATPGCGDDDGGGSGDTDATTTDDSSSTSAGGTSSTSGSSTSSTTSDVTSGSSTTASTTTSTSSTTDGPTTGAETGESSSSTGEFVGSAGCGMPAADTPATWAGHTVDVGETTREYWVWLPAGYDPDRSYPVVYQFHGCSGNENRQDNNPPVQDQSGDEAIHIRGRSVGNCWDFAPEGPDVLFFDALLEDVEGQWCADPRLRMATGYSSGAFMSHRLSCDRGDVLRGIATIAGGIGVPNCSGTVAALIIHDENDDVVDLSASENARGMHLERNGCEAKAATTPVDPEPCAAYSGCNDGRPVVWCQTAGQAHSRQDALAAGAFWNFLAGLDPIDPPS